MIKKILFTKYIKESRKQKCPLICRFQRIVLAFNVVYIKMHLKSDTGLENLRINAKAQRAVAKNSN